MEKDPHRRVAVLVLGDIGRSPRMQYHALALAKRGAQVDLIGYLDSHPMRELENHPRVRCRRLADFGAGRRHSLPRPLFLALAGLRLLSQAAQLLWTLLLGVERPAVLLTQTPPALPTLLVAWVAARCRGSAWMIDWHNFGYTVLALRLGAQHPVVRVSAWIEGVLARRGDAHLCVSRAMLTQLAERCGVQATVLYDRPAARFGHLDADARRQLFRRLPDLLPGYDPDAPGRPALIVSPTSWTDDEDFSLLLDAAELYEALRRQDARLPDLLVLVTGRGPRRESYEAKFRQRPPGHVHFHTAWLEAEDYPSVLAAADLGVSLHRSSSGVDLPMKVADMLGCGLPVCMFDYGPCVREMVEPERSGLLFRNAAELANGWVSLLQGFPAAAGSGALRAALEALPRKAWHEEWNEVVGPLLAARGL